MQNFSLKNCTEQVVPWEKITEEDPFKIGHMID